MILRGLHIFTRKRLKPLFSRTQGVRIWVSSRRRRAGDRGVHEVRRESQWSRQRRNWPNPLGRSWLIISGFAGIIASKCVRPALKRSTLARIQKAANTVVASFLAFTLTFLPVLPTIEPFPFLGILSSKASVITWTGKGEDNFWSNPANWSENRVPDANDIAAFDETSPTDTVINVAVSVAGFDISSSYKQSIEVLSGKRITVGRHGFVQRGGFFVSGSSPIDVFGSVNIHAGRFVAPSSTLNIKGNLAIFSDDFRHNEGEVVLSGIEQIVAGTAVFHSFTKEAKVSQTLELASGNVLAFDGKLTLTGAEGSRLRLRSSKPDEPAVIDPRGATEAAYLDVRNIINMSVNDIVCDTGCVHSGHVAGFDIPHSEESEDFLEGVVEGIISNLPEVPSLPARFSQDVDIYEAEVAKVIRSLPEKETADFSFDETIVFSLQEDEGRPSSLTPVDAQSLDDEDLRASLQKKPAPKQEDPGDETMENEGATEDQGEQENETEGNGSENPLSWLGVQTAHAAEDEEESQSVTILTLKNADGTAVDIEPAIMEEAGGAIVYIPPSESDSLKPGKYTLEVTTNDVTVTQDFTWGVLAMNFNKSTYEPGNEARIGMAVLDDRGRTICDATLSLHVTNPAGDSMTIDGEGITTSSECADRSVTDIPDYSTSFSPSQTGTYTLKLTAQTHNGERTLTRSFEVTEDAAFTTERTASMRIYPPADYRVRVTVSAKEGFVGAVTEPVPSGFAILDISHGGTLVEHEGQATNTILWSSISIPESESLELAYTYNAPDVSPEFYKLGPLALEGAWQEPRRWHIAADAIITWDGGGSTNNWTDCDNWSGNQCPTASDVATFNGTSTKDVTINDSISVQGIDIQSGYTGTITQGSGNTVTIGSGNYAQADGVFAGGDAEITINGTYTLSGGTFTSTGGELKVGQSVSGGNTIFSQSGGSFMHNNGTIVFTTNNSSGILDIDINASITFHNIVFTSTTSCGCLSFYRIINEGVLIAEGTFTHGRTSGAGSTRINEGTIEVRGDVTQGLGAASGGTTQLVLNGTGNQEYVSTGGFFPRLIIDKASGSVSPADGTTALSSSQFVLVAGLFTAPSGVFTIDAYTTGITVFSANSDTTFTHNDGTIRFSQSSSSHHTMTIDVPESFVVNNVELSSSTSSGIVHTYNIPSAGTFIVSGDLTTDDFRVGINGNWQVQGDITITDISSPHSSRNNAAITLTGSNDQSFTQSVTNFPLGMVTINKPSGTVTMQTNATFNSSGQRLLMQGGTLDLSTFDLTVNSDITLQNGTIAHGSGTVTMSEYNQTGGTFSGGSGAIDINGTYTLSGGTFTSTSGVMQVGQNTSTSYTFFTVSGGTFNHNNGTVEMVPTVTASSGNRNYTVDVSAGGITLHHVIINSADGTSLPNNIVLSGTAIVEGDLTHTNGVMNSGTWQVQGDLSVESSADGGSSVVEMVGTGNQSYAYASGGSMAYLQINKSSGDVAAADGITNLHMASFNLILGTFIAPSGVMQVGQNTSTSYTFFTVSGGTFNHNNGTVEMVPTVTASSGNRNYTVDVSAGGITLHHVIINSADGTSLPNNIVLSGTAIVEGDLTHTNGVMNSGTWQVQGDLSVESSADGGTTAISLTGSNEQTITHSGGTLPTSDWTVNKSGGTATLATNLSLTASGQDLTVTSGTLDMATFDLTVADVLTIDGGTLTQGAGTLTINGSFNQSSGTFNGGSGTIDINGTYTLSGGTFTSTSGELQAGGTPSASVTGFAISTGVFNHNNGTVVFNYFNANGCASNRTYTIDVGGSLALNHLTLNATGNCSRTGFVIISSGDTLAVAGDFTHVNGNLSGGTVEVSGNVAVGAGAGGGDTALTMIGASSSTYSYTSGGRAPYLVIDKSEGASVTPAVGTTDLIVGTFTLNNGSFLAPEGTFTLSVRNSNITIFAAAPDTTFSHNDGTVRFNGTMSSSCSSFVYTIDVDSTLTLNNVVIAGTSPVGCNSSRSTHTTAAGDTVIVAGDFTFESGLLNGTWELQGDITIESGASAGNATSSLTGANEQVYTNNGGSHPTGNWTIDKTGGSAILATDLSLNASGQDLTVTSGTFDLAGFGLTVNDTFTVSSGATVRAHGDETLTVGSLSFAADANVDYYGDGTYTGLLFGNTYGNLTFSGSGAYTLTGNLDVSGSFTNSATVDVSNSDYDITVAGDWINLGTLIPRQGTVTFDGTDQEISGNTTFYNFTKQTSTTDTLTFEAGSTQTVNGAWTVEGAASNILSLNSSEEGTRWRIVSEGDRNIQHVNVKDSYNLSTTLINEHNDATVTDDGNNIRWVFASTPDFTWLGEPNTTWSNGDNWVGGAAPGSSDTALFNGNVSYNDADITSNIDVGGIDINDVYTGTITQESGNTITVGSGNYTQAAGTFQGGDADITVNGTYTLSGGAFTSTSGVLRVDGSWTSNSGSPTFSANEGKINFNYPSSNITVAPGSIIFNDVDIVRVGGSCCMAMTIDGTMSVAGDLVIEAGTNSGATINGGTIAVEGDIDAQRLQGGTATILINGSGGQFFSGVSAARLPHIEIDKGGGTLTLSGNIQTERNWTHVNGAVDAATSTVEFVVRTGGTTITTNGMNFYNVNLGLNTGDCCAGVTATGTMVVENDFILHAGTTIGRTLTGTVEVAGDLSIVQWQGGTGSLILNGAGDQTITHSGGTPPQGAWAINKPSGTVSLATDLTLNATGQDLTVTSGTLNLAGFNLTVNDIFSTSANSTLQLHGDETITAGTKTFSENMNAIFNGNGDTLADTYTVTDLATSFGDLTIDSTDGNTDTFQLADHLTLSGNFTNTAGTFDASDDSGTTSYNMTVGGSWDNSGGTFNAREGTVTLNGDGGHVINTNGEAFYDITLNNGDGTWTQQDSIVVNNNLTITAGTLDASESNHAITVSGNWLNLGFFNSREGTVTLNGSGQSVSGSTVFHNLTKTTSSADTLTFQSGETQTIKDGGTLTLQGAASNLLTLAPSIAATPWLLNVGFIDTTVNVSHVDVSYSDADAGRTIPATNSNDGGDNINWCFSGGDVCEVSGTVYASDRTTPLTDKTIRLAINGVDEVTTQSDATTGEFFFEDLDISVGDAVAVYIEGETEKAVAVTGIGLSNPTGIDLYQDHLSLYHSADSLTNADLAAAVVDSETDISDIYTVDGSNNVTVQSGKTLYVPDQHTFLPGAEVTTFNAVLDGGLNIEANSMSVSGNWITSVTGSLVGTGAVTFTGSGSHTIETNGGIFPNLVFNGSGSWALEDALAVGDITLADGTFDVSESNYGVTVAGDWANTGGSFTAREGTVLFSSDGEQTLQSGGEAFYNATFDNGSGTWTLADGFSANNTVTLAAGTLDASGDNHGVALQGNWTNTGGTFVSRSGTVTFTGTNNQTITANGTIAGKQFYNVTVNKASGTVDTSGNVKVNNTFTLTSGTFTAPADTFYVGEFIQDGGTFTHNSGTVVLDGSGEKTLKASDDFNNLTINDTVSLSEGLAGYWKFDEGTDTTANDSSGNDNDGTLVNGPTWVADPDNEITFTNPFALDFDGTTNNQRVLVNHSDSIDITNSFTVSVWFRADGFGQNGFGRIVDKSNELGSGASDGYKMYMNASADGLSNSWRVAAAGSGFFNTTANTVTLGVWHHAVWIVTGSEWLLYHDGILNNQTATELVPVSSAQDLAVGNSPFVSSNSRTFDGQIDDVRIYNRALSPIEVATLAHGYGDLSATGATHTLTSAITVTGDFTLESGELDASATNYGVTVGGSWENTGGTFTPREGTVTFTGSSEHTVRSGASSFYNTVFDNATGTWTLQDEYTATNNTTVENGTLSIDGHNLTSTTALTVNDGAVFQLHGSELIVTTTATLNNGSTVVFTGNGDSQADTFMVTDYFPVYKNLVIASVDDQDIFELDDDLDVDEDLTVSNGILQTGKDIVSGISVGGTFLVENGGEVVVRRSCTECNDLEDGKGNTGAGQTITAGNLTIDEGGVMHADNEGFDGGEGPGLPEANIGGTHGGVGSSGDVNSPTYGSFTNPTSLGSGSNRVSLLGRVRPGGGAIVISSTGMVAVSGVLSASSVPESGHAEGGAGGSINITADTLAGAGAIRANGGAPTGQGNGGGGGRISLNGVTTDYFAGDLEVHGGRDKESSSRGYAGTIYFHEARRNNLTIGGEGNLSTLRLGSDDDNDYAFGDVVVEDGGILEIDGNPNMNSGFGGATTLNVATLDVQTGGTMRADNFGFRPSNGPGVPDSDGAGAYGGMGGNNDNDTYGSITNPVALGSGGIGGSTAGHGGGAVIINASGAVTINGLISATTSVTSSSARAGSGGTVNIVADAFSGSGTVTARGGNGAGTGANGGGGRIAVKLVTGTSFGSVDFEARSGSSSGAKGAAGTIYLEHAGHGEGEGDLIIDNNDIETADGTDTAVPPSTEVEVGTVLVQNAGKFTLSESLTTTGDITVKDTGILTTGKDQVSNITAGGTFLIENGGEVVVRRSCTECNDLEDGKGNTGAGQTITAGNLTIDEGGVMHADGQGFDAAQGPGAQSGSGGIYGGAGATNTSPTYGSFTNPTSLGSGGSASQQWPGGGAIIVSSTGIVTIDGLMGADGDGVSGGGRAGGSGGSINITADTLAGSGEIRANGGPGGAGSGGRISFGGVASDGFTGTVEVHGGGAFTTTSRPGYTGTIYLSENRRDNLTIGGEGNFATLRLGSDDDNDYTFGNIVIEDGGVLEIDSNPKMNNGEGGAATINVATIDVQTGGVISANGFGFTPSRGPGVAGSDGGGTHGGRGSNNSADTYGSITNPNTSGSGGTGGFSRGSGGGVIMVAASGTVTVNGTLTTIGVVSGSSSRNGSGGSINIVADDLAGAGIIRANGGSGSTHSGGGGRVAVKISTGTSFGDVAFQVFGGSGGSQGAAGTVYLEHANHGENKGDLIIDNDGTTTNEDVTTLISPSVTDTEVGSVTLQNAGKLQMSEDTELTVHGAWVGNSVSNITGGTITFTGDITASVTANEGEFNNVIFDKEAATWELDSNWTFNGDMTLTTGTLDATDNNYNITIAGDWNNQGTFTPHEGTVTFTGSDQSITGDTTFYNFTKVRTEDTGADHYLRFEEDSTQTILNTWQVEGFNPDNRVALYVIDHADPENPSHWKIDPQGTRTLQLLRVSWSENINEVTIQCDENQQSIDEGNNINWEFSDLTQSDWRWFMDSDDEDVTDPWGEPGLEEKEKITAMPPKNNPPREFDELRMRVNFDVGQCALPSGSQGFKVQYTQAVQCDDLGNEWADVADFGNEGDWRYAQSSVTDGTQLTAARLSSTGMASLANGLEGYWKFDEGTGTEASDSSGNANHGTLVNDPTWTTDTPDAIAFNNPFALQFNGSSNYVDVGSGAKVSDRASWSLSAWVNTPGKSVNAVYSDGAAGDSSELFVIYLKEGTNELRIWNNGSSIVTIGSSNNFPANEWVHVAITYDSGTVRYYRDGDLIGSTNVTINDSVGSVVRLGRWSDQYFSGILDDTRVYGRALTEDEIGTLAAGSTAGNLGRYVKSSTAGTIPDAVQEGQRSEWDFHVEHNGAAPAVSYCFRIVRQDGTLLEAYEEESFPTLHTRPGTEQLLRGGNFFLDEEEQGYLWAD